MNLEISRYQDKALNNKCLIVLSMSLTLTTNVGHNADKRPYTFHLWHLKLKSVLSEIGHHGGNSKGTTCVVNRDVTAYLVVDRVLRFPTEQYGCRYGGYPGFNDVKVIF